MRIVSLLHWAMEIILAPNHLWVDLYQWQEAESSLGSNCLLYVGWRDSKVQEIVGFGVDGELDIDCEGRVIEKNESSDDWIELIVEFKVLKEGSISLELDDILLNDSSILVFLLGFSFLLILLIFFIVLILVVTIISILVVVVVITIIFILGSLFIVSFSSAKLVFINWLIIIQLLCSINLLLTFSRSALRILIYI